MRSWVRDITHHFYIKALYGEKKRKKAVQTFRFIIRKFSLISLMFGYNLNQTFKFVTIQKHSKINGCSNFFISPIWIK